MAGEQQELTFKVIVDADTGKLKGVAQGFEGLKSPMQEAGKEGADAMDKIEHHVTRMAMSMFLGALALEGFKKLAEESGPFQELQGTIESFVETLLGSFNPALSKVSTGLQAVIILLGGLAAPLGTILDGWMRAFSAFFDGFTTVIAALINVVQGNFRGAWETMKGGAKDALGEFKGFGKEIGETWDKMVLAGETAMGRVSGANTQMTKIMAAHLDTLLTSENAHLQAMAKLRENDIKFQTQGIGVTLEKKLALMKQSALIEQDALKKEEDTKLEILKAKRESHQLTEMQYNDQRSALIVQYADQRKALDQKEFQESEALQREHQKALAQMYQQDLQAFAQAAGQKYAETKSANEALRAGGEAIIKTITDQAVKEITVYGAKTAAAAYSSVYNQTGGGYYGIAAGAAAAAGVMSEYGALAAIVGGIGYSLASSAGGGGGSSSTSSASSGAGSSSTGPTAAASSSTPSSTAAPTPQGGPMSQQPAGQPSIGSGQQTIIITLDGQVFAKFINDGTRDGQIQVHAKAIVP